MTENDVWGHFGELNYASENLDFDYIETSDNLKQLLALKLGIVNTLMDERVQILLSTPTKEGVRRSLIQKFMRQKTWPTTSFVDRSDEDKEFVVIDTTLSNLKLAWFIDQATHMFDPREYRSLWSKQPISVYLKNPRTGVVLNLSVALDILAPSEVELAESVQQVTLLLATDGYQISDFRNPLRLYLGAVLAKVNAEMGLTEEAKDFLFNDD